MGTVKVTNIEPIADNGTVTLGGSGDTIVTGSGVTANSFGVAMSDTWRVNANFAISACTKTVISSGWERADNTVSGRIGTGMSESSGVFTFPQTGIYQVMLFLSWNANLATDYRGGFISVTSDNSTYTNVSENYTCAANNTQYSSVTTAFVMDVTDTSTHKVRFVVESSAAQELRGSTSQNRNFVMFTRLGDT